MGDLNKRSNTSLENENTTISQIDAAIVSISSKLEKLSFEEKPQPVVSASAKGKMIASAIIMVVAVVSMVFSSLAYYTAFIHSSGNTISTGSIKVEFVDLNTPSSAGGSAGTELDPISFMPGHVELRDVYAINSGSMPLYLRAYVTVIITLDDLYASYSDEIDTSLVHFDIDDDVWKNVGGYYYYHQALLGGQITPEFFSEVTFDESMGNIYKDCTVKIIVNFQMVQAQGNGENVFEAVGWPTTSEGGAP